MKIDFKETKQIQVLETGDIVTNGDKNYYIIVEDILATISPYYLMDIDDCSVDVRFETLEEISNEYFLFKRKWEYKITDL